MISNCILLPRECVPVIGFWVGGTPCLFRGRAKPPIPMAGVAGFMSRTRRFKGGRRVPNDRLSSNGEKAPFSAKNQLSQRDFVGFLGGGPEGAASSGGAFRAGVSTGCS